MSARFPWTFFTGTTELGVYVMIKMEGLYTDYDTNLLNNKSPFIPLHQNYLLIPICLPSFPLLQLQLPKHLESDALRVD